MDRAGRARQRGCAGRAVGCTTWRRTRRREHFWLMSWSSVQSSNHIQGQHLDVPRSALDNTSSRSRVSAMNLVVGSEAYLRSATTDTKPSFCCCFLLWRDKHPTISASHTHAHARAHMRTHTISGTGLHVLVQTQKVIYEVHHFCFAEF